MNNKKNHFQSSSIVSKARDDILNIIEQDYEEFKKTRTLKFPTWFHGSPKSKLFNLEVEDCPQFGDTAKEFDSGRTAFLSIDMQNDFCGAKGYVDIMGYDLSLTSASIKPIRHVLNTIRKGIDIKIIHTREGHLPDLSDAPYNKILHSKRCRYR
jgi:biuret amidohydrolase